MTAASERRRAAIAVSGVTLVLLIAAGIHFIAPARPAETTIAPPVEALVPQAPIAVTSSAPSPAVEPSDTQPPAAAAPQRPRDVTARLAQRRADDRDAAASSSARADDSMLAVPLVASLEIPENSLRVDSLGMPVSADFVEPILPISESEPSGHRDSLARSERQRDPVTAAFVTAGNAVAGGFRSAGRALRRAF